MLPKLTRYPDAKSAMTALHFPARSLCLVLLTLAVAGCHAVDFYQPTMQQPVPPGLEPPRELSMMSLPPYRVEPPDILQLEMLKLVPLPPYRVEIYDILQIRVLGTFWISPSTGSIWSKPRASSRWGRPMARSAWWA